MVEFPSERKKIDIGNYYSDDTLIRSLLGWQPKVRFEEGIKRAVDYFRANFAQYV